MRTAVSTVAIGPELASPTYASMAVRCTTAALSSMLLHFFAKVVAAWQLPRGGGTPWSYTWDYVSPSDSPDAMRASEKRRHEPSVSQSRFRISIVLCGLALMFIFSDEQPKLASTSPHANAGLPADHRLRLGMRLMQLPSGCMHDQSRVGERSIEGILYRRMLTLTLSEVAFLYTGQDPPSSAA